MKALTIENAAEACPSRLPLQRWLPALVGSLVGFIAYLPTLWYGFVYDDNNVIVRNDALRSWGTLAHMFGGALNQRLYRPVVTAVVVSQYHFFKLHSWGYHLTSALLHALACALVYRVALQLSQKRSVAAYASVLFAVHAVHVEAVAWVSAFAEPLVASAILAGFSAYLRYRQDRNWRWLGALCLSFFFGLLTKETAIVLPLLVAAHGFMVGGSQVTRLRRYLPVLGSLSGTLVFYVLMRRAACGAFIAAGPSPGISFQTFVLTWPSVLIIYGKHLLVPTGLSPFYDSQYVLKVGWAFWGPLLLLTAIAGVIYVVSEYLDQPRIRFYGLAIVISIIPVLDFNIFQFREFVHDRFLYLPSVFFVVLVGELLAAGAGKLTESGALHKKWSLYSATGAGLILLNCAALFTQMGVWRNDFIMYSYSARMAPSNPRPAFGLADLYLKRGDWARADAELLHVVSLADDPSPLGLLGVTRLRLNDPHGAEIALRKAIALDPKRPGLHYVLASCLIVLGRTGEAQAEFRMERELGMDFEDEYMRGLLSSQSSEPSNTPAGKTMKPTS